ncbi:MAG: hypothetical protein J6N49_01210 [Alphaproteobacteria bacterium]|nr:hypothetical protein [Alphaproteobacteria bacterium]
MVDRETVKKIVLDAIRNDMHIVSDISEGDELMSDLGMTSLDVEDVECSIAIMLERQYNLGFDLSYADLNSWCTVGELIDCIVSQCEKA